ncbi:hypothetical protein G9464_04755 [Halostella sp. JP-L12]|uniref:hypothetical protein n=1 Tax=Halostella TaxID=1843185 RepID=UPI0013CEB469|nr:MULTISPECIES: hypothetical protein [Halostella]NHN46906.1 hypothetical protein [Halostella sp. JP-L12]
MRRRTRSRRRSGRPWLSVVVVAVTSLLLLTAMPPSASFDTGSVGRGSGIAVADDGNAILGLSNHSALKTGETCKLVNVTNRFDRSVTVTVALREDSEKYGNLTLGNGREGNQTSFSLGTGISRTVGLETDNESAYDGDDVYFHANATGDGVRAVATDRHSTIDDGASTTDCDITL